MEDHPSEARQFLGQTASNEADGSDHRQPRVPAGDRFLQVTGQLRIRMICKA